MWALLKSRVGARKPTHLIYFCKEAWSNIKPQFSQELVDGYQKQKLAKGYSTKYNASYMYFCYPVCIIVIVANPNKIRTCEPNYLFISVLKIYDVQSEVDPFKEINESPIFP